MLRMIFVSHQRRFKSLLSHKIRYKSHFTFFFSFSRCQSVKKPHSQRTISNDLRFFLITCKIDGAKKNQPNSAIAIEPSAFALALLCLSSAQNKLSEVALFCSFFAYIYKIFIDENYTFSCHQQTSKISKPTMEPKKKKKISRTKLAKQRQNNQSNKLNNVIFLLSCI